MAAANASHHCMDGSTGYEGTNDQYDVRHLSGGRSYAMPCWNSGYSSDEGMEYGMAQRQMSAMASGPSMMGQYGGHGSLTRAGSNTGNAAYIDPEMVYGQPISVAGLPFNGLSCLSGTSINEQLLAQGGRHASGSSFRPDFGNGVVESGYPDYGHGTVSYSSDQLSSSSLNRSAGLYTTASGAMMSSSSSSSGHHGLTYQYADTTGARDAAQRMVKTKKGMYVSENCLSPRN